MSLHRNRILAGALAIGILGAAAPVVFAQPLPAPKAQQAEPRQHRSFQARADGRIAFLKAELKITPAQAPAFDAFAGVIRQNAEEMTAQMKKAQEQHASDTVKKRPTALEQIERQAEAAKMQAAQNQRYLDAFKPLYTQLTDEQKKTADEILGRRHRHGGHGGPAHRRT